MKIDDYYEWIMLLNEGKELGLTEEDMKNFFQEHFKSNTKKKSIKKAREKALNRWFIYKNKN